MASRYGKWQPEITRVGNVLIEKAQKLIDDGDSLAVNSFFNRLEHEMEEVAEICIPLGWVAEAIIIAATKAGIILDEHVKFLDTQGKGVMYDEIRALQAAQAAS